MRARSSSAASGSSARTAASALTDSDHTAGASRLRDAGATTSPRRSTVAPWISATGRGARVPRTSRAPQILRDATPSVPHRRTPGRVAVGSTASRSRPFTLVVDHVDAFELRADRRQGVRALDELHSWRPPENARGLDLALLDRQLAGST